MAPIPPRLENRGYHELLADTLARIPSHTPEWTNFHHSDPGVTLLELFAFLAESAIYRANLVPERNRRAFVDLLGVPRSPGRPAQGIVALAPARELEPVAVPTGLEVYAGSIPFRLTSGLDVLPLEALAVAREALPDPDPVLVARHRRMYQLADREGMVEQQPALYRVVPVGAEGRPTVLAETVDGCAWIALLVPRAIAKTTTAAEVRRAIAGRTLSVGVVAAPDGPGIADAHAASSRPAGALPALSAELPRTGRVVLAGGRPHLEWATVPSTAAHDLLADPGVLHVTLPGEAGLQAVAGADPLEAGVGELPPDLQDAALEARVVTWLRLRAPTSSSGRLVWVGLNAATVSQRGHVTSEPLGTGTGRPDQALRLARTPVVSASVRLRVREPAGEEIWTEIGDLFDAGGEVATQPLTGPPGSESIVRETLPRPDRVFVLEPADGTLHFGDGRHGRRPPPGAAIVADYDYALGAAGNVAPGAISSAPALPAGVKVSNPVRTWGGADAESVADAERHAARYVQHRDRLVTPEDIEAIALRTPGVDVGRVEVIGCYDPQLGAMAPGDAAGCVTVMAVPRHDAVRPETPEPDQAFLDTVCRHLAPRRLVTTELFVRGPSYVGVWLTVGYRPVAGRSPAEVERAISLRLRRALAALDPAITFAAGAGAEPRNGWPLGVGVERLALAAEVARADGVEFVTGLRMAAGDGGEVERIPLGGLQLPRVLGVLCAPGDPPGLDAVRGIGGPPSGPPPMPIPALPEDC